MSSDTGTRDNADLDVLELATTRSTKGGWWVSDKTAPSGGILIRAEDASGVQRTIMDIAVRDNSWDVTEMLLAHSALPALIAELRLARSGVDAVMQHYAEKNWCDICRKTLALANPDTGWKAGHKPDCPLAAYEAFREGLVEGVVSHVV